jgi:hypothetical protein
MPWRAYLQTQPASVFVNGVGVNLNLTGQNANLIAEMLAKHGITRGRIEVGWGSLDYQTASKIPNGVTSTLQAAHKWGIRPLILLNANSGGPCPNLTFSHTLTADAPAGATTLQLDDVSNLVVGYSGVNTITSRSDPWMAEGLVTAKHANAITISKPLVNPISAGTSIAMATLRYRPFSTPLSPEYKSADVANTLDGWTGYVNVVAAWAATTMGVAAGSQDMGFDLEVWNELTFGSHFLFLSDYFDQAAARDAGNIYAQIVRQTADAATAHPESFSGVTITDGFANTIPWPASSQEPARVTSLSKHPYTHVATYPADEQPETMINALFAGEHPALFVPTYSLVQPEYAGTAIQTETMVRDMGPSTNDIYGVSHGENARVVDGEVSAVGVMITETGIQPLIVGATTTQAALNLKAKDALRTYSFYLNKGVSSVFIYAALGVSDADYGLIQHNFSTYATSNSAYPGNDAPYVSPALSAISNMVAQMRSGLDPSITAANARVITVNQVSDTHDHYQFEGDGTPAHPNLYDRELFTFLPYQVNSKRFVIPYYVMTVNETNPLTPEYFTVDVSGIDAVGADIAVYDPIRDVSVPVTVNQASTNEAQLTLLTADYPYLLIVQER